MENRNVESFLELVRSICEQRDHIIGEKGYGFNIFTTMRIQSDEVKLHSALLAELLNPNGTHQMGSLFLNKFLDEFTNLSLDLSSVKVEIEKYVREISADKEKGGRLDILITDKKETIIIENKIYATDQEKQLVRYYNYNKNAHIIYLTLDGHSPSAYSCGELNMREHYHCLSYEKDIIRWLEDCLSETIKKPLFHYTLVQYINTLKELTNQSLIQTMDTILSTAIKNNMRASFEIERAMPTIRNEFHSEFWLLLTQALGIKAMIDIKDPSRWQNYTEVIRKEIGIYEEKQIIVRFRLSTGFGIYIGITTSSETECKCDCLQPIIDAFPTWSSEKGSAHIVWKAIGLNFWNCDQNTTSYMSLSEKSRHQFIDNVAKEFQEAVSILEEFCRK